MAIRTANGRFNGKTVEIDDIAGLTLGQDVVVVFAEEKPAESVEAVIDLKQFVSKYERGENGEHIDAVEYVRGLRDNDRF